MSRFEEHMNNDDSQNGPKIKKSWDIEILLFEMMKLRFYWANVKQEKSIKIFSQIKNSITI